MTQTLSMLVLAERVRRGMKPQVLSQRLVDEMLAGHPHADEAVRLVAQEMTLLPGERSGRQRALWALVESVAG